MDINKLLCGKENCSCGKNHSCDIKRVEIGSGAINTLPDICKDFRRILLVSDNNTYRVLGQTAKTLIADKLQYSKVFEPDGLLIPNEQSIDELCDCVLTDTDLIVGVGSGVINDLCKYVSFKNGLPYIICATAPSMDGYASVGAAMITGNMKTTFNARVPYAIIGDVDVLKDAPLEMIKSGFGDIIGKYSALNDWKLSALVNNEYICDYVYTLVYDTVERTRSLASGILKRDPKTVETLMQALVIVGIAMAYVGNSRPASGSEHHLSHYFEITGLIKNRGYLLHGIDVFYSTLVTEKLRERIIALPKMPEDVYRFDRGDWAKHIGESYGFAADGIIALQDKVNFYGAGLDKIYREKWDEIVKLLKEVPSCTEISDMLHTVDMDYAEFESFYGKDVIDDAVLYAKDLKDRYTVLWLYFTLFAK